MSVEIAGKFLVTGGTGFLGENVVRRLVSEGISPIVTTRNAGKDVFADLCGGVELLGLDLLDGDSIRKAVKSLRPEVILHLAGATFQTEILEQINFAATVNLLEAARASGVKKIVMLGTADEYGFQKSPQHERMATMPVSDYAVSKNKAVRYALSLCEAEKFPVTILRPFTIYGSGQPSKMFISQAVGSAVAGKPFEMSEGRQKRDALFVTDFVNAIIKTLTVEGIAGEIFNVGSGASIALRDLARKIWQIAGADEKLLKIGARPTGQSELHDTEADITKISKRLDWQPAVSLDEGLKIFIEDVRGKK